MRHICFCHKDIGNIDRGGVCVLFKTLMLGLVERGWFVSCITQREFNAKNINVIRLSQITDYLLYAQTISKKLKELKPDIAECSNWRVELIDFARNKGTLDTKIVVRSDPSPKTLFRDIRFFEAEKELYRNADKVLAVSDFAKKDIEKTYQLADIDVIHNAVDEADLLSFTPKQFLESGIFYKGEQQIFPQKVGSLIEPDKINIFWCGKATSMKGFDYLEQIVLHAPENLFFIVNTGNSPQEIKWSAKNLNNIVFAYELKRSDQLSIWKQCDVFLSTSRAEGFGLALLEGLILGLPVIANTYCSVYHEFLPNDKLFLIDVADTKLVLSYLDKVSRGQFGDRNHREPDLNNLHFTKDRLINASERIYNNLLGI